MKTKTTRNETPVARMLASIEALRAALARNAMGEDTDFARDLVTAYDRGTLTYNKSRYLGQLIERLNAPPIGTMPVARIVELLTRAKASGERYPTLWLQMSDLESTPLRITIAGAGSRTPGVLQLTDGGPFGGGRYFGAITPEDGTLTIKRDGVLLATWLVPLLAKLNEQPAAALAAFGQLTGFCSLCGGPLKAEHDIAAGYMKDCATRYGVPFGSPKPQGRILQHASAAVALTPSPRDTKGRIQPKRRAAR